MFLLFDGLFILSSDGKPVNDSYVNRNVRQQLTLFADPENAQAIESIRKRFNPEQYRLIRSHVTLCREDEIANLSAVLSNLRQLHFPGINIQFGPATRFDNGIGVLLPASGNNESFHRLRSKILMDVNLSVKRPEPHITLMHPRNAVCTDDIFREIQAINLPRFLHFDTISFIEQVNGGPWQTLESYKLNSFQ